MLIVFVKLNEFIEYKNFLEFDYNKFLEDEITNKNKQ